MSNTGADNATDIAIIGMAGRFPGANSVDQFWQNLCGGVESIRFFTNEELEHRGVSPARLNSPQFVKAGAVLDDIELFDAAFFDLSPIEATITDPQQRLFLECAWEALENAGYDPGRYEEPIGVYAGSGMNTYMLFNLAPNFNLISSVGGLQLVVGNDKDYLATRVSYKLNLRGPSINIQTACSTSLVAVSVACQSLLDYQCSMALAGGVSVKMPQLTGYTAHDGDIVSPDGHCRTFDARAEGTVFGSGLGIVVLKRVADAIADGDHIHAVIKGFAVNNDGSLKIGYTAPSVDGQMAVIAEALSMAGVEADTISYVEAHGTGTPLGDPIEMAALKNAFGNGQPRRNGACAVGSVKTNIGHLDTAAGVAGLIKTVLALEHKLLPGSLHFERPNPGIDFANSAFYVNTSCTEWKNGPTARRAGVSSFGIGGTNAHVILEEAPVSDVLSSERPYHLLLFSARSESALDETTRRFATFLQEHPNTNLADAAFTLQVGRRAFSHRRMLVTHDVAEASTALEAPLPSYQVEAGQPKISFMFTGQGAQYVNMGRGLYETEATFRQHVDECAGLLKPALGLDLRDVLYPLPEQLAAAEQQLNQTALTQPALFVIEYALARLWMQWGIVPQSMIGHSIGEYVAACLAGVFSLRAALDLVVARGRMMQALPAGAMLAVSLPVAEVEPLLGADLSLAADNGPRLCVASGPFGAVSELEKKLALRGDERRRLHTSHAFHSQMMQPIVRDFTELVQRIVLKAPQIPFVSNVTGTYIKAEEATDPHYWARHLLATVRFGKGVRELLQQPSTILLEVGPGETLSTLAKAQGIQARQLILSSLRHPREEESDAKFLMKRLGQLWLAGAEVDWPGFYAGEKRHRVALPTYPFERQRYWIDPPAARAEAQELPAQTALPDVEPAPASVSRASNRRRLLTSTYVAPRDEVEQKVARIWESFLAVDQLGVHDNFFELGGHSLLATQLIALVRNAFQLELPLRVLFDAPTVAELAVEIQRHQGNEVEAVENVETLPQIKSDPEHQYEPFPLTDVQQAYWVGRSASLELGNLATHIYFDMEIEGIDLERLEFAVQRLVARHPMLRTIVRPDGQQQVLAEVPPYRIETRDLRQLDEAEKVVELGAIRAQMSHQILPADEWPLFEIRAARLTDTRVRLHVSYDMLIGDAWSFELLRRQLLLYYSQPDAQLRELGVTFRDYVVAETAWHDSETYRRAQDYWWKRIEDLPPAPELPLAQDPASLSSPHFVRRLHVLRAPQWERLKQHGARAGVTPSVLLLAAYAEVLSRWSKQQRFTINLTLFNRLPVHEQINDVVGDFTSLTLLAVEMNAAPSFMERARRLQQQLWEDMDHRAVSGVAVLREMARRAGGARTAMPVVFTSELNFTEENQEETKQTETEQPAGSIYSISQTPQVWLDHQVSERRGALIFNWDSVEELFPAGMVEKMFAAYCSLLTLLAEDEQTWERDHLPLLPAADRELQARANATAGPLPSGLLHSGFLTQAALHPEHLALLTARRNLSYGELQEMSSRLAHRVFRLGVQPNQLVAVVMVKGWEQVVATLAILQAGAAYLPINAELPGERIEQLLEDAKVKVVLTQSWVGGHVQWPADIKRLAVDTVELEDEDSSPIAIETSAADLAYVIYTSGSTGKPKGVMIEHQAALNTIVDLNERYSMGPTDRVFALSSLSFDLSVYDVFGTLAAGATIVLPEAQNRLDVGAWLEQLEATGVTLWNSVPALMQMLVEYVEGAELKPQLSLRLVWMSGDWIPLGLPGKVKELAPQAQVISMGGATEAAIWSILYEIDEVKPEWTSVPYGHAMRNQRMYVLNERLEECPQQVVGYIHIGGAGLARGYWGDEEKTARSFIVHPVSGERLYRTGDLGRWLADGEIEFLGREDQQVKVGGHRVELGEVEAALGQAAGVSAAVVVAVGERLGHKRLVAYLVPEEMSEPPDIGQLRSFLSEKLPEYMIPSNFVVLESLPLTPNGKVNRNALPSPEQDSLGKHGFVAPRTPIEELLASSWIDVLGLERVGIYDNFFELGGDSLLATRIISQVRGCFQVDVPLGLIFETPTISGFTGHIESALRSGTSMQAPPLVRISQIGEVPLSFAQQRLWFLNQLEPDSPLYNLPLAVRLKGRLNITALEQAMNEIVRRHQSLRTTFHSVNGQPVQHITPSLNFDLATIDLSDMPHGEREAEVRRLADAEARQSFDLTRSPLLRGKLLRLSEVEHAALLTIHHIISDGWSIGLLMQELAVLYGAYTAGQSSPLADLPLQYPDFALWQSQWLQGEVLEEQLSYWQQQLAGELPVLELPMALPRPPAPSYRGAYHSFHLPSALSQKLKALSRREGTTLFMTLLAAFQTLLGAYTESDDVIVGTDIANRNRAETENLIGFFVNQLVLRTDLSGNPTFTELLGRVRTTALQAYAHQDLPFEKLVEILNPDRSLRYAPVFQVKLLLQNVPQKREELPGLTMSALGTEGGVAKFDLTFSLVEDADNLSGTLEYSLDLFEAATIKRMAAHFQTLLESVTSDPTRHLSDLNLVPEVERRQLLVEWNETRSESLPARSIQQLFEEQARQTPTATALVFEDEQLSYAELNQQANQLAHYLCELGVGPEVRVGVCVERSADLILALLAVAKADGAYVPLDPAYPLDRLAYIIEDAQLPIIITQERLQENLPAHWGQLVCLDSDIELIREQSVENPVCRTDADNLAYVIYTSGSTGEPKGVMVSHGGLVNHALAMGDKQNLSTADRCMQFVSPSFDAAIEEIFPPLISGAALVMHRAPSELSSLDLLSFCREQRISVLHLPPAFWHSLVSEMSLKKERVPATLRVFLTGGESPALEKLGPWLHMAGQRLTFLNAYGPTEATITTTVFEATIADPLTGLVRMPVGRPIANTEVYLLNPALEPVPIGVPGELYIGGAGVTRGYLRRADLTAAVFVPHPFSSQPGSRLYKTGDRARYLPDGQIELLGRTDQQVKIRGFRIELGEIETVLAQHPAVRDVLVMAREDSPGDTGDKRLVAYIIPTAETPPAWNELRVFVREKLPEYMMPAAFVTLKSFPMMVSGKVDRNALPAPDQSSQSTAEQLAAPRNPTEEMLLEIWREVLGISRIGINDNFFELGGHSLLATQVVARVREVFAVEVQLRGLFEAPTVAGLAASIIAEQQAGPGSLIPPILPIAQQTELPLSFAQQRLWFIQQLQPDSTAYNFPLALRLVGALDVAGMQQTLSKIVRRHESLRTSFPTRDGTPVQLVHPPLRVKLPLIDLTELPGAEREAVAQQLAQKEAQTPFDLAQPPLMRACLVRLSEQEHVALFTLHHIVGDGWSMEILVREVIALYAAHVQQLPATLPELRIQYKDYAVWQRQWLQGEVLEKQLAYWGQHLGGHLPVLELPADKARPAVPTYRGARQFSIFPETLTAALKELCRREGVTMYMALLAAFQVLLRRYTEQDDIIVGSPSAGRSHVNTEGLIGFFVNTLAMRTDLSGNPSFKEVLGRVRTVVLGAHAHQDVPFERLVELLQPERSLGHNPIVQAWFVLMNTQPDDLELPGLTISSLPTPPGTVKLDLGLTIAQEEKTLSALLEYNTDLFNDETIIQMLKHLGTLLAGVVEDPEVKVLDIPLGAVQPELREHRWSTEDAEAEFLF